VRPAPDGAGHGVGHLRDLVEPYDLPTTKGFQENIPQSQHWEHAIRVFDELM
jgi:hypothetical protein